MNVNDINLETLEGDKLELIFARQKELMEKYHHIEESQGVGYGILQGRKLDLNEIRSQCLLKDFAWRVTEEITEAMDALDSDDKTHFKEELADALHFLTELCLKAGVTPDMILENWVTKPKDGVDKFDALLSPILVSDKTAFSHPYPTIHFLGLAMNCLKQKPWKKTHILTDVKKFQGYLVEAYQNFCRLLRYYSNSQEMFDFYFKKSKVNDFRIKTNY